MICFIGLGGNEAETYSLMQAALKKIESINGVSSLATSRLFETAPVSDLPQANFLNAVCRFETVLSPVDLFKEMEQIEKEMGKREKPKNAPRPIDLDFLFYGSLEFKSDHLTLPHPAVYDRLFVLIPLADLVDRDFFLDIQGLIEKASRLPHQWVTPLQKPLPFQRSFS